MADMLLQVDASPRAGSATRELTATYAEAWLVANPGGTVVRHDLAVLNPPHLNATEMGAWFDDPTAHTDLHHLVLARSNDLIDDVLNATEIVFGVPMWNFSIPSSLKAWIDHVVRAGRTFQYTETGVAGAVPAHRAVVLSSSGSDYAEGSELEGANMVGSYLSLILGFIGIEQVDIVHVNRQGPTWPDAAASLAAARVEVLDLVEPSIIRI